MPARGLNSGLSAEAAAHIFSDPKRYKAQLVEFAERQDLAQAAEAKARQAEGNADAAVKKAERAERRLAEKVAVHETNVYVAAEGMAETTMKMDKKRQDLEDDAGLLRVHEEQLTRDRTENSAHVNRLAAQAETLAAKEADLVEREATLEAGQEAINIREGKFANRLREFNADL